MVADSLLSASISRKSDQPALACATVLSDNTEDLSEFARCHVSCLIINHIAAIGLEKELGAMNFSYIRIRGIATMSLAICVVLVAGGPNARGQNTSTNVAPSAGTSSQGNLLVTPDAQEAVDKGLEYLASRQHSDGSFGSGTYHHNVAVTSLSGMAMMSAGNTPGRGLYGDNVERAIQFVLSRTSPDGFVCDQSSTSHGPMYDHGFGTLFLAEVYGMTQRPELREKLTKAVQLIVRSQNAEGGWRYHPIPQDADVSVTICQIMALRAARNAGLYVPTETVNRCIEYVKRCQNNDGGFRYRSEGGASDFPRSAAGVVALYSAGVYEGPEIEQGLNYLKGFLPGKRRRVFRQQIHYFYGHYYAVQAMWHAGDEAWQEWYPAVRDELIGRRRRTNDNAWTDNICNEYGTAMACIILQMPNNYLPIFQR